MGTLVNGAIQEAQYTLVHLDRERVKNLWPFVRHGLKRIKQKDPYSGHWRAEHVRQRIEAGFAGQILCECHAIVVGDKPVGFVVLTAYNDEFDGVPERLWVWIAWCENAPLWKVLPHIDPMLERRAKDLGLRGVIGCSSREQWVRRIAPHGYKVRQYIFFKDFEE